MCRLLVFAKYTKILDDISVQQRNIQKIIFSHFVPFANDSVARNLSTHDRASYFVFSGEVL